MSRHLKFNDYTDIYCPVEQYWAEPQSAGDRGPSEPLCSECGAILEDDELIPATPEQEKELLENLIWEDR